MNESYWESDEYKIWLKLSRRDYHYATRPNTFNYNDVEEKLEQEERKEKNGG